MKSFNQIYPLAFLASEDYGCSSVGKLSLEEIIHILEETEEFPFLFREKNQSLFQFILSNDDHVSETLKSLLIVSNNEYFLLSSKELEEVALQSNLNSKDVIVDYLEVYKKNGNFCFLLFALFSDFLKSSSEDLFSDISESSSDKSEQIDNDIDFFSLINI
jgi:hypothetical protein